MRPISFHFTSIQAQRSKQKTSPTHPPNPTPQLFFPPPPTQMQFTPPLFPKFGSMFLDWPLLNVEPITMPKTYPPNKPPLPPIIFKSQPTQTPKTHQTLIHPSLHPTDAINPNHCPDLNPKEDWVTPTSHPHVSTMFYPINPSPSAM